MLGGGSNQEGQACFSARVKELKKATLRWISVETSSPRQWTAIISELWSLHQVAQANHRDQEPSERPEVGYHRGRASTATRTDGKPGVAQQPGSAALAVQRQPGTRHDQRGLYRAGPGGGQQDAEVFPKICDDPDEVTFICMTDAAWAVRRDGSSQGGYLILATHRR
eukprot:5258903-Pyramimonas_sp.AAC.1